MRYVNPATGEEVTDRLPKCDTSNPAELEAWFGNFAYADHFRKVVLSSCVEAERAKAVADEEKVTEAKLENRARTSDNYVQFLVDCLYGRTLREQNVRDSQRTN